MFTSTIYSIGLSLLKEPSIFLTYIGLSIFFSLNSYFLVNSKLITSPVALLFNNASTITPSCVSILSKPIFTVTSLNKSPLFRLQQDILSITLLSIANLLLLLRSNQGLLDLHPHLNYFHCSIHFLLLSFSVHCSCYHYILVFFSLQFCFLNSYNFLPNVQILHNYNSSDSPFYPHPWHIGCIAPTLLSVEGVLLLH